MGDLYFSAIFIRAKKSFEEKPLFKKDNSKRKVTAWRRKPWDFSANVPSYRTQHISSKHISSLGLPPCSSLYTTLLLFILVFHKKVTVWKKKKKVFYESILFTALLLLDDLGLYGRFSEWTPAGTWEEHSVMLGQPSRVYWKDCPRGRQHSLKSLLHSAFTWLHRTEESKHMLHVCGCFLHHYAWECMSPA